MYAELSDMQWNALTWYAENDGNIFDLRRAGIEISVSDYQGLFDLRLIRRVGMKSPYITSEGAYWLEQRK